jgi:aerobic C4-dicarboxylate transport protein
MLLGVLLGFFWPASGGYLNFLSQAFIRLLRMITGPIVFCTIVLGIAQHHDLKKAGRIALKAFVYFEVVTTIALSFAMLMTHWMKPGAGLPAGVKASFNTLNTVHGALAHPPSDFYHTVLEMIPDSLFKPFVDGYLLHLVFIGILVGVVLVLMRQKGRSIVNGLSAFSELLFGILHVVMILAPLAVLGSMAYTVSQFGLEMLIHLGFLVLLVFGVSIIFVVGVLGSICFLVGLNLKNILYSVREEIILTFGTSSSEVALPRLLEKLTKLGCDKEIVALVLPTGYSFNLDGMSIYLGVAVLFIMQAYGIDLSWSDWLSLIGLMLLISKGSAGVTGAGFITLTAMVSSTHLLPMEGLALLMPVDRFMSTLRSLVNVMGNVVATCVVDRWERRPLP